MSARRGESAAAAVPIEDIDRLIHRVCDGMTQGHAVTTQALGTLGAEYREVLKGHRELVDRLNESSKIQVEQAGTIARLQAELLGRSAEERKLELEKTALEMRDRRVGEAIEMGGKVLAVWAASKKGPTGELKDRLLAFIERLPSELLERAATAAPDEYRALFAAVEGAPASETIREHKGETAT